MYYKLTKAVSLVVTLCAEATPTARVHHRRISSLDDVGHTLGLVGEIFYPLVWVYHAANSGPYFFIRPQFTVKGKL
jgi:hypothetical protein